MSIRATSSAVCAVLALACPAFAGFTFTYEVTESLGTYTAPAGGTAGPAAGALPNGTNLYAINIYALNTGGDTGTGISALEVTGSGLPTLFVTNATGAPDAVNYDADNGVRKNLLRSFVTLEDFSDNDPFIIETFALLSSNGREPATTFGNQGSGGQRTGVVNPFRLTGTGAAPDASSALNGGKGLQIAHIVVGAPSAPTPANYTIGIQIGGSAGPKVTDTETLRVPDVIIETSDPPVVTISPSSNVVIDVSGPGLEGFSGTTVTATDNVGVISFTAGAIPAAIADNVTITGGGSAPFNISGANFTYGDLGSYQISFTAVDSLGSSTTAILTIQVFPEPATVTLLSLKGFVRRRRR